MIPGSNIFWQAASVINLQEVMYLKDAGRTQNKARQWVTTHAAPVGLMASVQAVKREKYAELGLEFQKKYVKIFAAIDAIDIDREVSGDQFIFGRELFQLESQTTWYVQDGWMSALAVKIKILTQEELDEYERQRSDRPSGDEN